MLTGDNEKTARQVSEELGLDGYFAEVLPEQKQEKIKEKMIQNLIWATGYNIIAIPLAAGVLSGIGIVISPAI